MLTLIKPTSRNTLELLPDEILIMICQYLSSTDVLISFYGLNFRLNQTIRGYTNNVVLAQIAYPKFKHFCTSVLPHIGENVCSLAISNQWKGILSKLFISYFGDKMFLIFPNLQILTFTSFNGQSLKLFLDCLQNFPNLHEIRFCHLYQTDVSPSESHILLDKIFTTNNSRLNTILFDDESIIFSFQNAIDDRVYCNITKLNIDLRTKHDLRKLLTYLPKLASLNVNLNTSSLKTNDETDCTPHVCLKYLKLQSFGILWTFDELKSILICTPNVEHLSITIESENDMNLLDGEQYYALFSNFSLKSFNYFLRVYDLTFSGNPNEILSTWVKFKEEIACVISDDKETLYLYTLPFAFSYLILSSSAAKNKNFIECCASQVKVLTLYDVSKYMVDTFSIIENCPRLHTIYLRIQEGSADHYELPKKKTYQLLALQKFVALRTSTVNANLFQRLLETSPNLSHLEVNYEFLCPLLKNEFVCKLLTHRITHMYMLICSSTSLESIILSIPRFVTHFESLRHLYFSFEKGYSNGDLLILTILNHLSKWTSLISFGVVGAPISEDFLTIEMQQWIKENNCICTSDSFITDYTEGVFRLWL